MAGPLKQESVSDAAIAAVLWGGILRFGWAQLQKSDFLLALQRHREANFQGFLLSDGGTRAADGRAVLRAALEVMMVLWHQNIAFSLGVEPGETPQCGLFSMYFVVVWTGICTGGFA